MYYIFLPLRNFPFEKTFYKLMTALVLKIKLTIEFATITSFDLVLLMTGLQLSYKEYCRLNYKLQHKLCSPMEGNLGKRT